MADLLEAGVEALADQVDIVGELLGSLEEAAIGHHQRGGEIVEQRQLEDVPAALVAQAGRSEGRLDRGIALYHGELKGDLEKARGLVRRIRQVQDTAMGIEAADEGTHHRARQDPHPGPVTRLQALDETCMEPAGAGRDLVVQTLRQCLQLGEVVAAFREDVADTLHGDLVPCLRRRPDGACLAAAQVLAMEAEQDLDRLGGVRRVGDEVLDLAAAH